MEFMQIRPFSDTNILLSTSFVLFFFFSSTTQRNRHVFLF